MKQCFCISDSASFFVPEWEKPILGNAMLALVDMEKPRVCYIGAAKGDCAQRALAFYRFADRLGFIPHVLSLFDLKSDDFSAFFKGVDVIFVDGGSTRNLLALLREWGIDRHIREAYENGITIAGASAGANMMFEWGLTDSVKSRLDPIAGFGLLPGTICVHHNANPMRPASFQEFLTDPRATSPVLSLEDGVALHYVDQELTKIYSRWPEASCRLHEAGEISKLVQPG